MSTNQRPLRPLDPSVSFNPSSICTPSKHLGSDPLTLKQSASSFNPPIRASLPSTLPSFTDNPSNLLGKPTWSRLFYNSSATPESRKLGFIQPVLDGSFTVAVCKQSEIDAISSSWEGSVEGLLVGKRPHIPSLKKLLLYKWNIKAPLEITLQKDGSIWFRFSDEEEKKRVLDSGPYFVAGHVLILRPWRRRLALDNSFLPAIPIWIRLPGLPIEFWSADSLSRVKSLVGTPLFMDDCTTSLSRTKFARLCIEVSALKSLPEFVMINTDGKDLFEQLVHYEWRPSICNKCHVFFHKEGECSVVAGRIDSRPGMGNLIMPKGSQSFNFSVGAKDSIHEKEGAMSVKPTHFSVAQSNSDSIGWTVVGRNRHKKNYKLLEDHLPAGPSSISGEMSTGSELEVRNLCTTKANGKDGNTVLEEVSLTDNTPHDGRNNLVEIQNNLNLIVGEKEMITELEGVGIMADSPFGNETLCCTKTYVLVTTDENTEPDKSDMVGQSNCTDYLEPKQSNPVGLFKQGSPSVDISVTQDLFSASRLPMLGNSEPQLVADRAVPRQISTNIISIVPFSKVNQSLGQATPSNPKSCYSQVQPIHNPTCIQPILLLKGKDVAPKVDNLLLAFVERSIGLASSDFNPISEEEDRVSYPPGFNSGNEKSSNENSIETAIHVIEETSDTDEETNGFSRLRARMIREKLGISFLGT